MLGIDARAVLAGMLRDCGKCNEYFRGNVALITSEDGTLTDEQVSLLIIHIHGEHEADHVVH